MLIHEIFARFLMNKKYSAKLVAKNVRAKEAFLFTFSISVSVDSIWKTALFSCHQQPTYAGKL